MDVQAPGGQSAQWLGEAPFGLEIKGRGALGIKRWIKTQLNTLKSLRISVKQADLHICQSCPTLCDPMNCSPPGSPIHGIFQARVLEWVPFPSPGGLPNLGMTSPKVWCYSLDSDHH